MSCLLLKFKKLKPTSGKLKGSKLEERIKFALDFTGLSDVGKKLSKEFSGGMKRRLNVGLVDSNNSPFSIHIVVVISLMIGGAFIPVRFFDGVVDKISKMTPIRWITDMIDNLQRENNTYT